MLCSGDRGYICGYQKARNRDQESRASSRWFQL